MNYKVLFQKLYVVIFLLLTVVVHLAEPVEVIASDASGTVDGAVTSFGFNNPTDISGIKILDSNGDVLDIDDDAGLLTRVEDFVIEFFVYDLDGFKHLDVYVALFNNNTTTAESTSGKLITAVDGGVTDNAIVFRWMSKERSEFLSGLAVTSGVEFAFDINSGVENIYVKSGTTQLITSGFNSGVEDFVAPSDFNDQTGVTWIGGSGTVFSEVTKSGIIETLSGTDVISSGVRNIEYRIRIPFTMSKVAPSSGVWTLGVMVHDQLQREIDTARTDIEVTHHEFAGGYYKNQFYGEVEVLGTAAISFTNVEAGSGNFQTSDQSGAAGVYVRFIANGTYNQSVQSDSTWDPVETSTLFPDYAFLVAKSGLDNPINNNELLETEGNRFALQVRRTELNEASGVTSFVDVIPNVDGTDNLPPKENSAYRESGRGAGAIVSEIALVAIDDLTSEVGITARFEFGLKLSAVFQNTTYNGNISIGISNNLTNFFTPGSSGS